MNSIRIFVFVTAVISVITKVSGQVHDVVLCRESTKQQTVECGFSQIIDIQSVTLAHFYNRECSLDHTFYLRALIPLCKRIHRWDGNHVYSRCHGEHSCTVDGSMVDEEVLSNDCGIPSNYYTNVLWFNYTCHNVDPTSPFVALLPLPENREVRGYLVEIFSPYYPCYIPRSDSVYELYCKVTPHRKYVDSEITYRVQPKYIEILQNNVSCQDYIAFDHGRGGEQLDRRYCSVMDRNKERWNDAEITSTNKNEFYINYFSGPNVGDGTKFWFNVSAEEYGEPIEVSVNCTGQENIPPLHLDSSCVPIHMTTTTAPATTTTTTTTTHLTTVTDREASSAGETREQISNGGLIEGLIATSIMTIVVVIAIVLGLKLRKTERDKQEVMQPTNSSPDDPDYVVGTGTGSTDQLPVLVTTPITMTTKLGPSEDIWQNAMIQDPGCSSRPDNSHTHVNNFSEA